MTPTIYHVTVKKPLEEGVRLIKAEGVRKVREFLTDPLFEGAIATPEQIAEYFLEHPHPVIETAIEAVK